MSPFFAQAAQYNGLPGQLELLSSTAAQLQASQIQRAGNQWQFLATQPNASAVEQKLLKQTAEGDLPQQQQLQQAAAQNFTGHQANLPQQQQPSSPPETANT